MLSFCVASLMCLLTCVIATVSPFAPRTIDYRPLATNKPDWWQTASFYQIYPRSFQDSNGDGIGDLRGITKRLPYLRQIGVRATWLSPIFKSPMADFGYDISDFFEIQPEYGTMKDFDEMIRRAKELGIKVLMDFVPNHSSDENEWFIKSVNRTAGFEDFYVWHAGYPDPKNASNRLPPSNWISIFWKSAWEWNPIRNEFYLHQFAVKQPDLNYRNPKVVEAMKSVLRFWLDKGVDGFRIDAVPCVFEVEMDENGRYMDNPKSGNTDNPDDPAYHLPIYTQDRNETLDMLYEWRKLVDDYQREHGGDTRVLMTESYSNISTVMRYYGDGIRQGSHIPFNFYFITQLNNNSQALDYKVTIDFWMNNMPAGRTANWVMGNHDQKRLASRFGVDRIDMMNMIRLSLPGASVTYNGEELGMTDVWISWNDTVDPAACNTNPNVYERYSRDPARTPFQWDNTTNAGFSVANKTWLPVSNNYHTVNVDAEMNAQTSNLKVFLDMMELRKTLTYRDGNLTTFTLNENVLVIIRQLIGELTYLTIANIGGHIETVDLSQLPNLPNQLQYRVVGISSEHKVGQLVVEKTIKLQPKESFVLVGDRRNIDSAFFGYHIDV